MFVIAFLTTTFQKGCSTFGSCPTRQRYCKQFALS